MIYLRSLSFYILYLLSGLLAGLAGCLVGPFLNINNRIKFLNSDIDNFLTDKYDLIISNPPYIKQHEINGLEKDIKNYVSSKIGKLSISKKQKI